MFYNVLSNDRPAQNTGAYLWGVSYLHSISEISNGEAIIFHGLLIPLQMYPSSYLSDSLTYVEQLIHTKFSTSSSLIHNS